MLLTLNGTHGTTVARVQKIQNNGFIPQEGRRGTGVYFWAESRYSRGLAIAWWEYCLDRNYFKGDNDTRCSVIYAEIKVEKDDCLNIERHDFKKRVSELASKRHIKKRDYSALYDLFIKTMEEGKGKKISVLESCVSPPQRRFCPFYPEELLGNPSCFIVRTKGCINIVKIENDAKQETW